MKRMLVLTAAVLLCLMLSGCSLLMEKHYGHLSWDADAVFIDRWGDGRCLLLTDPAELAAMGERFTWVNAHIECCMEDPDFRVWVYADGELVGNLEAHDRDVGGYNRAFAALLQGWGQLEPNAFVVEVTIPAGVTAEAVSACVDGMVLPCWPETTMPRSARVVATCVTVVPEGEDFRAWMKEHPLGEFDGDTPFLPLRDALAEAGVLRYASDASFRRSDESGVTRQVTFYVTELPALTAWEGLGLTLCEAEPWTARIVTGEPLSDAGWAALHALGVTAGGYAPWMY